MTKLKQNMWVWGILQILLPSLFVIFTFILQFSEDSLSFSLMSFCKSQRLLLISSMILLNMGVLFFTSGDYSDPQKGIDPELAKFYSVVSISLFVLVFMIYVILLSKPELFSDDLSYMTTTIGTYLFTIGISVIVKLKVETKQLIEQ